MRARHLSTVLAIVASTAGVTGCSATETGGGAGAFKPAVRDTLTIVTSQIPTPGMWEGTPGHLTGGLEYELARRLQKRFGLHRLRVLVRPFDEIARGHLSGADMALSLVTPTRKRDKHLDFAAKYFDSPPALLARSGKHITSLASARDLTIGTIAGSTFQDLVPDRIDPKKPLQTFPNRAATVAALQDGTISAAMLDLPLAQAYADRSHGRLAVAGKLDSQTTVAPALPDGSDNEQAVSSAVRQLIAKGKLDDVARTALGATIADINDHVALIRSTR